MIELLDLAHMSRSKWVDMVVFWFSVIMMLCVAYDWMNRLGYGFPGGGLLLATSGAAGRAMWCVAKPSSLRGTLVPRPQMAYPACTGKVK